MLTRRIQQIAKSVTAFACANPAPLLATADARRYMTRMESTIKHLTIAFIVFLTGCASTNVRNNNTFNEHSIGLVNIHYHSLRKEHAKNLGEVLKKNGYLVNIQKAKPIFINNKSYIFIKRENQMSAAVLNDIASAQIGHPLRINFFKEKGEAGTADIILTNVELNSVESSVSKFQVPQLWSHHKLINGTPETCAVKGISILTTLGFESVVKNGNYVYGNFNKNRAAIKCVNVNNRTFVYTAVAGADVKVVEKLRNEISWKL